MTGWRTPDIDTFGDLEPPAFDGWGTLLAAIEERRPEWQLDAACRYAEDVTWFPERGESPEPAKSVCARCPVDLLCDRYASELDARHGVWAGVSVAKPTRSRAA